VASSMMLVAFTFLPRKPGEMFLHSKDPQCTNYVLKCLLQLAAEVKQRTEHSVAGGKTHIKWPPPTDVKLETKVRPGCMQPGVADLLSGHLSSTATVQEKCSSCHHANFSKRQRPSWQRPIQARACS
jgi:hypothetical protein